MQVAKSFYEWYFSDIDTRTIGIARISTGLLGLIWVINFWGFNLELFFCSSGAITNAEYFALQPLNFSIFQINDSLPFVLIVFIVLIITLYRYTLGFGGQINTFFVWFLFYSFSKRFNFIHAGPEVVLGNFYFFMIFTRTNLGLVFDYKLIKFNDIKCKVNGWGPHSAQINICIFFFFAGLAKALDPDHVSGKALNSILAFQGATFDHSLLLSQPALVTALGYSVALIEFMFSFLVWFEQTRSIILITLTMAMLGIFMTINVSWYPIAAIATLTIFINFHQDVSKQ